MTKIISIVLLALLMTSFVGYLGMVISSTLVFSSSESMSEVAKKNRDDKTIDDPLFPVPTGDPINDPKPNCR